ncbi:hypothetical protein BHQ19_19315 [Mycolicibacterium porcinum]|nr:hypothetical protein BHQ19_19315 [Mycolicibacterium porcinum]
MSTEHLDARLTSAIQNLSTPDTVAAPLAAVAAAAAFPNPLEQWTAIVTEAVTNLTLIGQLIASDPAPILQQIVQNQLGYGQTYVSALETVGKNAITLLTPGTPGGVFTNLQRMAEQFAAGDIQGGFSTIQSTMIGLVYQLGVPMLPAMQIPVSMARNFANVVELLPTFAFTAGLGAVSLIGTTINTIGPSGQAIADALKAGDPVGAVGALLSTPGNITQTVVNGWMGFGGGLIGPHGLVTNLLKFRDTVAGALGANAAEAAPAAQQLLSDAGTAVATGTAPALTEALAPGTTATVSADATVDRAATAGESQLVEHAKTVGTSSVTAAETREPIARDSLVAVPGTTGTGTAANKPAAKVASTVRDGISATVNKIGENVKKAFAKPKKKSPSASTDKGASAGDSGDGK